MTTSCHRFDKCSTHCNDACPGKPSIQTISCFHQAESFKHRRYAKQNKTKKNFCSLGVYSLGVWCIPSHFSVFCQGGYYSVHNLYKLLWRESGWLWQRGNIHMYGYHPGYGHLKGSDFLGYFSATHTEEDRTIHRDRQAWWPPPQQHKFKICSIYCLQFSVFPRK